MAGYVEVGSNLKDKIEDLKSILDRLSDNVDGLNTRVRAVERRSVGDSIPRGAVMAFYLNTCPSGWRLADGRFATPDLRGVFIRGLEDGQTSPLGIYSRRDIRRALGSYQEARTPSHRHFVGSSLEGQGHFGSVSPSNTFSFITGGGGAWQAVIKHRNEEANAGLSSISGSGTDVRPRNVALLYCMKR